MDGNRLPWERDPFGPQSAMRTAPHRCDSDDAATASQEAALPWRPARAYGWTIGGPSSWLVS
jgi:hypothetical protein